jgi:membrane-associated phospholipid phosphatase
MKATHQLRQRAQRTPLLTTVVLLLLYLVPAIIFVALAKEVGEGEIFFFDRPVMDYIHSLASPGLTVFFQIVTEFGGTIILPVVTCLVSVWLYFGLRRRKMGLFLFSSVGGAAVLNLVLKSIFQRTRPDFWQHLVQEHGYSFPSGHAMGSAALAVCVVVMCWRSRWRWVAVGVGTLYMVLVGLSRIYLGVHYPSDIVAGWCMSVVWVLLLAGVLYEYMTYFAYRHSKNHKGRRRHG